MGTVHTSDAYYYDHKEPIDEVTLADADATIEGDKVVWDIGTALGAARTFTVRNYDKSRHSCYRGKKPLIVIKCSVDASGNNAAIDDEDGTTLFTFAADYSVTPGYAAFTIDSTGAWELV